jgi:hypothetical protein
MQISLLLLSFIFNIFHLSQGSNVAMLEDIKVNPNLIICHQSLQYKNLNGILNDRSNLQYSYLNDNAANFKIAEKSQYKCGLKIYILLYPITRTFAGSPENTYRYEVSQGVVLKKNCDIENVICRDTTCDDDGQVVEICCNYNFCNENRNINLIKASYYLNKTMARRNSDDKYVRDNCYPKGKDKTIPRPCVIVSYKSVNKTTTTAIVSDTSYPTAITSDNIYPTKNTTGNQGSHSDASSINLDKIWLLTFIISSACLDGFH